jgi:hypothetical protein
MEKLYWHLVNSGYEMYYSKLPGHPVYAHLPSIWRIREMADVDKHHRTVEALAGMCGNFHIQYYVELVPDGANRYFVVQWTISDS